MNKQINVVEAGMIAPCLNAMFLKKQGKIDVSPESMAQHFEEPLNRILARYGLNSMDVKLAFQPVGAEMGMGDEDVYLARHRLEEIGIKVDDFNAPDVPKSREIPAELLIRLDDIV
ncbi:MAG: hypothetical protein WC851_04180 [Candidatus Shapirobacteria bacterium]|jgi:hypothetical protein